MIAYQFNDIFFDLRTRTISFRGKELGIGKKSVDALEYLIRNRHRAVSRAELQEHVWRSSAISASAIPTCLMDLRRKLSNATNSRPTIRTIRGIGYQFVAELAPPSQVEKFVHQMSESMPLQGRRAELEKFDELLLRCVDGNVGMILLVKGEAGIGKSRILSEFGEKAAPVSRVEILRCPNHSDAGPFWPWSHLFTEESVATTSSELAAHTLDDATNRSRPAQFNDWIKQLREFARHRPLTILVDDLHRADEDSLLFLRWVIPYLAEIQLVIVATLRPTSASSENDRLLAEIEAETNVSTIILPALKPKHIESLTARFGNDAKALADSIRHISSGNPFLVDHLIRFADSITCGDDLSEHIRSLPPSWNEILQQQLSDLPSGTRVALEAASVVGLDFSIEEAASCARQSAETTLEHLSTAARAGLLENWSISGSEYRFRHALLRDALYESTSCSFRASAHKLLADHLIKSTTAPSGTGAVRILDHLEKSRPLSDPLLIAQYSRNAGELSLRQFGFSKARAFLATARELIDECPDSLVSDQVDVRILLAKAQLYSHDRQAARSTILDACERAREAGLNEQFAKCALALSPDFLTIEIGPVDPILVRILEESILKLPDDSHELRSAALARLSLALAWTTSWDRSAFLALEALTIARRHGDQSTLAPALAARSDSLHGPDRIAERLATNLDLKTTLLRAGDALGQIMANVRSISALLEAGEIDALDREIVECEAAAAEVSAPEFSWYPVAFRAMRSAMAGDHSVAAKLSDSYLSAAASVNDSNVLASRACQACLIALEKAQTDNVLSISANFVSKFPGVRSWAAGRGLLLLRSGKAAEAQEVLDRFDHRAIQRLFREPGGSAGVAFLAELAVTCGDVAKSAQLYDLCAPTRHRFATLGYAMAYLGSFARYAGLLAGRLGLHDEAIEHHEYAISAERRNGAPTWRMLAEVDLHDACSTGNRSTDMKLPSLTDVEQAALSRGFTYVGFQAHRVRAKIDRAAV